MGIRFRPAALFAVLFIFISAGVALMANRHTHPPVSDNPALSAEKEAGYSFGHLEDESEEQVFAASRREDHTMPVSLASEELNDPLDLQVERALRVGLIEPSEAGAFRAERAALIALQEAEQEFEASEPYNG